MSLRIHVLKNSMLEKEVVLMSITFTKIDEVDKSLVCERKSSDRYGSFSQLLNDLIVDHHCPKKVIMDFVGEKWHH